MGADRPASKTSWHPCENEGCLATVEFDDEPWCFNHSPDGGSDVQGYSYKESHSESPRPEHEVYAIPTPYQARIAVLLVHPSSTDCSACRGNVLSGDKRCSDCGARFVAEQAMRTSGIVGAAPDSWTRQRPDLPYFDAYGIEIAEGQ